MKDVTAIVLCGGLGTRLRPVVSDCQKCMAYVNDRPFIYYILDQLRAAQVQTVILAVNYLSTTVSSVVGTDYHGVQIQYSTDQIENGGNGHAVRMAVRHLSSHQQVLIMNGDTYVQMNLDDFYHGIPMDATGFCINVFDGIVNMGMYLTDVDRVVEVIPESTPYRLEASFLHDTYLYGVTPYLINAPYLDIGTPEAYCSADRFMRSVC